MGGVVGIVGFDGGRDCWGVEEALLFTYRMSALISFLEEGERGKKHVLLATFVHKHVLF